MSLSQKWGCVTILFFFFAFVCFLLFICLGRAAWTTMDCNVARESRCPNLKESLISSFRDSLTLQAILLKGIRLYLVKYRWSITSFWFCNVVRWSLEYFTVYQYEYIFHNFLLSVFVWLLLFFLVLLLAFSTTVIVLILPVVLVLGNFQSFLNVA